MVFSAASSRLARANWRHFAGARGIAQLPFETAGPPYPGQTRSPVQGFHPAGYKKTGRAVRAISRRRDAQARHAQSRARVIRTEARLAEVRKWRRCMSAPDRSVIVMKAGRGCGWAALAGFAFVGVLPARSRPYFSRAAQSHVDAPGNAGMDRHRTGRRPGHRIAYSISARHGERCTRGCATIAQAGHLRPCPVGADHRRFC